MAHKKQTGEKISSIAARVLAAGNPLRSDEALRKKIGECLRERVEPMTQEPRAPTLDEVDAAAADAMADVLDSHFADARSLAASALSQDETKGKRK